jgi:hypothetical protein
MTMTSQSVQVEKTVKVQEEQVVITMSIQEAYKLERELGLTLLPSSRYTLTPVAHELYVTLPINRDFKE